MLASAAKIRTIGNATPSFSPLFERLSNAAVNLEFSGKEVRWTLTNNGVVDVFIERITIEWPNDNGILTEIKRDGSVIHKGNFQPTSAVIDSGWEGDACKRTIKAGDTDTLKFKFVHDAALTGNYVITVEFDQGCSIMVTSGS